MDHSPKWLRNKQSTINHKSNYCKNLQIISNIKPSPDQYNWKEIIFSLNKKDWKKFESNKSIVLNILYVLYNTKEIKSTCTSKNNLIRHHQHLNISTECFEDIWKWNRNTTKTYISQKKWQQIIYELRLV